MVEMECHSELTEDLRNRALPYRTSIDGQLHSSVGELLVPTCVEQDVQELCAPMLRVLIAQYLEDDRRWSLQELQAHTGIDQATVHKTYEKICIFVRKLQSGWYMLLLNNKKGVYIKLVVFIWKGIKMKNRTC